MRSDPIPGDDHVVRYVRSTGIDAEGRVNGSEFRLRPHRPDDVGLSVNWLECFGNIARSEQLRAVRRLFRLSVRCTGRFVELNVGQTRLHLTNELPGILFVEDPLEAAVGYEADPLTRSLSACLREIRRRRS